jgi:hypothetical protein
MLGIAARIRPRLQRHRINIGKSSLHQLVPFLLVSCVVDTDSQCLNVARRVRDPVPHRGDVSLEFHQHLNVPGEPVAGRGEHLSYCGVNEYVRLSNGDRIQIANRAQ